MISSVGSAVLGDIKTRMVSGRGFTPEEVADMALDQIIYIGAAGGGVWKSGDGGASFSSIFDKRRI